MFWLCKTKLFGCEGSNKTKHRPGFSLVELMAVVAVIGILVSLALPRFRTFIARSRQAEAQSNLGVIHKLQKSYNLRWSGFGADNVYHSGMAIGLGGNAGTCGADGTGTKNSLGFRIEDCDKLRYTYITHSTGGATAENLNPATHRIYPNCTATPTTGSWNSLSTTADCFGGSVSGTCTDQNGDGVINILDLVIIAGSFGTQVDGLDFWAIDSAGGLGNPSDAVAGCSD